MKVIGNHILVSFEDKTKFKIGSLELHRPEGVYATDVDGTGMFVSDGNVNRLEVNPQIATVIADSERFGVKKGDQVFMHYMAWEWAKEETPLDIEGEYAHLTEGDYIIAVIRDGELFPVESTYLGKRVFLEAPKTESGIYLTPYDETKVSSHIKITHIPSETQRGYEELEVGQIAISIDDKQYAFQYNEEEYIKLKAEEIVGWVDEGVLKPMD